MIGSTIGRYRIVAKLGEGGMGSVWKAEDTLLGRTIALKFLPETQASSPEARKRFLREAQAASVLDHPGIATVFDAGEADGRVYIALQHVDGETVAERLERGPLPVGEAVRIARAAAEGLQHAHERGILHRDVSARNIMVARDGRVIVVDFGLALPEGQTRITQSGATLGTVAYMAPELILGGEADRRSDLYSLGVVLYEMLAGALPFTGERPQALLYAAVHGTADPPSFRRPDLPPDLDHVVSRAMAKEPVQRYASASAVAEDLESWQLGRALAVETERAASSSSAAPTLPLPVARGRAAPPRRVRRRIIPALGIGIAFLGVGSIAFLALARSGVRSPSWLSWAWGPKYHRIAVLPFRNSSPDPGESDYLIEAFSQTLTTKLTQLSGLGVTPWITSQRYDDFSRPLDAIAQDLRVDGLVVGTYTLQRDSLEITLSFVDKNGFQRWADEIVQPYADLLNVQRQIALSVATRLRGRLTGREERTLELPVARSAEAYEHYARAAYALHQDDPAAVEVAARLFQKALNLDPELAEAWLGTGTVQMLQGSHDDARDSFRRALQLDPTLAAAHRGLIRLHWWSHDGEACLAEGQEVARLGLEGVENLLARAEAFTHGALYDEAEPLYARVFEMDPDNPAALNTFCFNQFNLGKYREAIDASTRFLSKFGEDSDVRRFVGHSYHCLDQPDSAAVHYARVLELDSEELQSLWSLASLYKQQGDTTRARAVLLDALEVQRRTRDPWPWALVLIYALLGDRMRFEGAVTSALQRETDVRDALFHEAWGRILVGDAERGAQLFLESMRRGFRRYGGFFRHSCLEFRGIEQLRRTSLYPDLWKEYDAIDARLRAKYGTGKGLPQRAS